MKLHIEVAQQQWDLKKNLHNLLEQGLLEQSLLCQTVFQIQTLFREGTKKSDAEETNESTVELGNKELFGRPTIVP